MKRERKIDILVLSTLQNKTEKKVIIFLNGS